MPPPSPLITPPALLMMVPLFVLIAAAPLPAKVVNVPGVHDVIDAVAAAAHRADQPEIDDRAGAAPLAGINALGGLTLTNQAGGVIQGGPPRCQ